jgi:hypothetical protein
MADQRLDQLKAKYQSVLNLMNQLDVRLSNLHVQDNKLVVRGQAKTKADSNKVWDQIKLVDKNYQHFCCRGSSRCGGGSASPSLEDLHRESG